MLNIQNFIHQPKDAHTMVARKGSSKDYEIKGVVVNKKTSRGYNVEMQMDTEKLTSKSNLRVYCSCHDFKFRWAYPLSLEGALMHPNDFQLTPAKITNPDNLTNACKHIHIFVKYELDNALRTFGPQENEL